MPWLGNLNTIMVYGLSVVVALHSYKFRGAFKTFILFFGALLVGITIENINALFGGYEYPGTDLTWFWGKAPFSIGLGWFVLLYVCNFFSHALIGKYKGSLQTIGLGTNPEKGIEREFIKITILRSALAAAIAVSFDLVMDPVSVRLKFWIWEIDNIYIQGVPLGNYCGWFLLIFTFSFFHDIIITHFSIKNAKEYKISAIFVLGCILAALITGLVLMGLTYLFGMPGIRTEGLDTHPLDPSLTNARIEAIFVAFIIALVLMGLIIASSLAPNRLPEPRPTQTFWYMIPSLAFLIMWGVVLYCAAVTDPYLVLLGLLQPFLYLIVTIYFLLKPDKLKA